MQMQVFYGECKHCKFDYAVAGRVPNYCPECGESLWKAVVSTFDTESFQEQRKRFIKAEKIETA